MNCGIFGKAANWRLLLDDSKTQSDLKPGFTSGEQKKLKGLTLNQRVLGSSPRGLTRAGRNGSEGFRSLFVFLTHSASKRC
jgi:hypothetical protein